MTEDTLTLYADYVCPFCYLGRRVLGQALADHPDPPAIAWHPFDLRANRRNEDGELGAEEHKDESYYEQAWRNVERLADEYGVPTPNQADREIDSLLAQQAALFVRDEHPDRWAAFDDALYRAHWQEDRNIGDPAVLEELGTSVGLPNGAIDAALEDDANRRRLEEAFDAARRRGVTAVPTFVYEGNALQGAVPPARIRELLEAEASPSPRSSG